MEPAKALAWQRFRDRVLSNTDWPRSLWLAAVEDALRAALGADSRLLADYRADVAELLSLERSARGSYHDEKRIGQLETQLKRLIDLADETISEAGAEPAPAPPPVAVAEAGRRRTLSRPGPALSLVLGMLLFLAGIGGATAFYQARMSTQDDAQMARMAGLLDHRVADLRADLDRRLSAAERLNAQMTRLHAELNANVDQFSATMTESVRSMMALSDNAIAELERRLAGQGGGVTEALGHLQTRADALDRGLDDVSLDLSSLERRLPRLRADVQNVVAGVQRVRTDYDQAAAEIDAMKADAPALVAWLEDQRGTLAADLQTRRIGLEELDTQVQGLKGEVDQSRALLQGFSQSLGQGLQQAKQDGEALKDAVESMRDTGLQVTQLMDSAEANVQAAHEQMQQKIDQMLSDVAEKADLAVLRGQDVVHRAEGEIGRKLQSESQAALDALTEARVAHLAELAKRVSSTQVELEQTRAGLITSWQRMDQAVAERQSQVLTGLDGYATTIQTRVQELLNALDVKTARTDG